MKRNVMLKLCGLAGLLATTSAWSIPISTVGAVDQLIAQTDLGNSGDAGEKAWVAGVLNLSLIDLVYETKDNVNGSDWEAVTGTASGVWAYELSGPNDWFLIKTGNIADQPNRHFLFNNLAGLDYAVVNLLDLGINKVTNVSKISHVGEFNGPRTNVPEPATLGMFGAGLLGMGFMRRRKARKG